MPKGSRRKSVLSADEFRGKVADKLAKRKVAMTDQQLQAAITATMDVIVGTMKNEKREGGDILDVPGFCRVELKVVKERAVRAPKTGKYTAKGATRALAIKPIKAIRDKLDEVFAKEPSAKIKAVVDEKNGVEKKSDKKGDGKKKKHGKKGKKNKE